MILEYRPRKKGDHISVNKKVFCWEENIAAIKNKDGFGEFSDEPLLKWKFK